MKINSKRLLVKKMTNNDLDNYLKLVTNEEVMQLITGKPYSRKEGTSRFGEIIQKNKYNEKLSYYSIF